MKIKRVEFFIGIMLMAVGSILMAGEIRMCRATCWINDLLKIFLPKNYSFLANGLPEIIMGFAFILYAVFSKSKDE